MVLEESWRSKGKAWTQKAGRSVTKEKNSTEMGLGLAYYTATPWFDDAVPAGGGPQRDYHFRRPKSDSEGAVRAFVNSVAETW
jgi:hypothetical protein